MRCIFALVTAIILAGSGFASLPQIKSYGQQKDLIAGSPRGISITWEGELLLAPPTPPIFNSERPFIWDFVIDPRGNFYVATGDGAKIFQVNAKGQAKIIAHWDNSEVYSLACDQQGTLYAGISPDGKIYRILPDKKPELFADLKGKYIWDIQFDKQNRCYVATGDSGHIYLIDAPGKAALFYRSEETHLRCLAWDINQHLLAGSYPNGYIYKISPSGQALVVYDSEFQEIHQLCVAKNGTIYAAGLGMEETKSTASPAPKPSIRVASFSAELDSSQPAAVAGATSSGIIKIHPNGVIKNIWPQTADPVQSIALTEDETLLVGSAEKGRLFKVNAQDESTYLLNFDAAQIIAFKSGSAGNIFLATSNLGKLFQLKPGHEPSGVYESEVFDAGATTHWGSIQWDEQASPASHIKFFSRSGNTATPNSTWNSWTPAKNGEVITSPEARFIQWKLELATDRAAETPRIKNIRLSYLQHNLPPEISSITVHPVERQRELEPPASSETPFMEITIMEDPEDDSGPPRQSQPPGARRQLQNGYRRVSWKSQDQNDDKLSFDLYFQDKNDPSWWPLKKDLIRSSHIWDSRLMPDGSYRIKVIADDRQSNPINTAQQSEKISDWFVIDNTGPRLEAVAINMVTSDSLLISFAAVDDLSPIKQVQFSADVQNWRWVYPSDRVCDSKKEWFRFRVPWKTGQFHSIVVKAVDSAENTTYNRLNVKE